MVGSTVSSVLCLFLLLLLRIWTVHGNMADRNGRLLRLLDENRIKQSGDIELGAMFSVRTDLERGEHYHCTGCDFPSLLASQAFIYQVDKINLNENILPNYTLGYEMMDDCYNMDLAVKAATMYMMGETVVERRKWIRKYRKKRMDMARNKKWSLINMKSPKVAIIGPSISDISTAIGSMTSVNYLPVISYSATSCELSQKKKYPSFMRTVPSDQLQVSAMADVIKYFNWTYISAVGTDDTYGQMGVVALKEELLNRNICLAKELLIDYRMSRESIVSTLNELFNDSLDGSMNSTEVVVLICNGAKVQRFLDIVQEKNINNKTWIASESWGYRLLPVTLESAVGGSLGLVLDTPNPKHFMMYMNELTIGELRAKNPWFYRFLEERGVVNSTTVDDQTLGRVYRIDPVWYTSVTPIMDAIKAVSLSMHRLIYDRNRTLDSIQPIDLLRALRRGVFPNSVDPSIRFRFDENGDVQYGYKITNLKKIVEEDSGVEMLRFETVGKWLDRSCPSCECPEQDFDAGPSWFQPNSTFGQLCFDESVEIVWPSGTDVPPESTCQKECPPGTYRIYGGSRCCWSCRLCPENQISNYTDATCCKMCKKPMISNPAHTACVYRNDFAEWQSAGEIVALTAAGIGLIAVLLVACVLFKYRRTPVVICSNCPLTFILLYLLATAFTLPPIFVIRPSTTICFAETLLFGFTFSTITAIFFTKTYHVHQIFTAKLSHTLHLLSQRGLQRREIWLSLGLGAAVLLPTVPYLSVYRPSPAYSYSGDCGPHWINAQFVNMAYIALLSLATTYVSFRARNLPENYNEAHTVATTMLMLMLVWMSSIPSYYRVAMSNRALILGLAVDAAAFCILVLVFGPKLYLIYIEPHKNTPLYVSKMNMIHLWKQQSKKRMGSTSSRRTDSGEHHHHQHHQGANDRGSSPVRKKLKLQADKLLKRAKKSLLIRRRSRSQRSDTSS